MLLGNISYSTIVLTGYIQLLFCPFYICPPLDIKVQNVLRHNFFGTLSIVSLKFERSQTVLFFTCFLLCALNWTCFFFCATLFTASSHLPLTKQFSFQGDLVIVRELITA